MPDNRGEPARLMRVRGPSMVPTLWPGDWLVVEARTPRLGDIAVVRRGEAAMAHRFVSRLPRRVKGDSQGWTEPYVPADLIGTAVRIIHLGEEIDLLDRPNRRAGRAIAARAWFALARRRLLRSIHPAST